VSGLGGLMGLGIFCHLYLRVAFKFSAILMLELSQVELQCKLQGQHQHAHEFP
jgi:hypothetical protein